MPVIAPSHILLKLRLIQEAKMGVSELTVALIGLAILAALVYGVIKYS